MSFLTQREVECRGSIEANSLIESDCLKALPYVPTESIDMILCDLPFALTHNLWDSPIDLDLLWEQYRRVLKPMGVIILNAVQPFTTTLICSNREWFRYTLVWEKNKFSDFMNAKRKPLRIHEDIVIFYPRPPTYHPQFTEGTPYVRWNSAEAVAKQTNYGKLKPNIARSSGTRYPTTVLKFNRVERPIHSTQKPVDLGRWLIRSFSNPGDTVLDNASGVGSYLVSAWLEGRNFIGIEQNNPEFYVNCGKLDCMVVSLDRLKVAYEHIRGTSAESSLSPVGAIKLLR